MKYSARPQKWFWIVSIIFLMWNLMGLGAWSAQFADSSAMTEDYTQEQLDFFYAYPDWYQWIFGIAVFTGVIACILLLFKKKSAVSMALVSLITVLICKGYDVYAGGLDIFGTSDKVFLVVVPLLALLLWMFTRSASHRNWIR